MNLAPHDFSVRLVPLISPYIFFEILCYDLFFEMKNVCFPLTVTPNLVIRTNGRIGLRHPITSYRYACAKTWPVPLSSSLASLSSLPLVCALVSQIKHLFLCVKADVS